MQDFYRKLDSLYEAGDMKAVEDYLQLSASNAKLCCGQKSLEFPGIMNELGSFYRDRGQFERALASYDFALNYYYYKPQKTEGTGNNVYGANGEESCKLKLDLNEVKVVSPPDQEILAELPTEYAVILVNKANCLRLKGELNESEKNLNWAKNIYNKKVKITDFRYLTLLNIYSQLYSAQGKLDQACQFLEEALEAVKQLEENDAPLAVTYANLAAMYEQKGELSRAKANALAAQEIFKLKFKNEHPHYAAVLHTLAHLEYYSLNYVEAKNYYEKAKLLTKKHFGHNHNYDLIVKELADLEEKLRTD